VPSPEVAPTVEQMQPPFSRWAGESAVPPAPPPTAPPLMPSSGTGAPPPAPVGPPASVQAPIVMQSCWKSQDVTERPAQLGEGASTRSSAMSFDELSVFPGVGANEDLSWIGRMNARDRAAALALRSYSGDGTSPADISAAIHRAPGRERDPLGQKLTGKGSALHPSRDDARHREVERERSGPRAPIVDQ
jgi:hypothetical protein